MRENLSLLRARLGDVEFERRAAVIEKMDLLRRDAQYAVRLAVTCSRVAYVVDGVLYVEGSRSSELTRRLAPYNRVDPDRGWQLSRLHRRNGNDGVPLVAGEAPAMNGWIKLHRLIVESAVFQDEHLLRLWIWVLAKACFKTSTRPNDCWAWQSHRHAQAG